MKELKTKISGFQDFRVSGFSHREGSSLIEVLMAMLILVVLVLGVASYIYYGRSNVYAQRNRLSVLEIVNGRLEALRAVPFIEIKPPNEDYGVYYTVWQNKKGKFATPRSRIWPQRFDVNSRRTGRARRYQVMITVQYVDVDGGTDSYDALKLTVSVRYRRSAADGFENVLSLSTYRMP